MRWLALAVLSAALAVGGLALLLAYVDE